MELKIANARMECVKKHAGARRKEPVATVGALVTVIAVAEATKKRWRARGLGNNY
jgi:hypothetical protein